MSYITYRKLEQTYTFILQILRNLKTQAHTYNAPSRSFAHFLWLLPTVAYLCGESIGEDDEEAIAGGGC